MPFFRKKPVVIEARQFAGEWEDWIVSWMGYPETAFVRLHETDASKNKLSIHTLAGVMEASAGDWIIRGVRGELYPCKPEIFAATYEAADNPSDNSRGGEGS